MTIPELMAQVNLRVCHFTTPAALPISASGEYLGEAQVALNVLILSTEGHHGYRAYVCPITTQARYVIRETKTLTDEALILLSIAAESLAAKKSFIHWRQSGYVRTHAAISATQQHNEMLNVYAGITHIMAGYSGQLCMLWNIVENK